MVLSYFKLVKKNRYQVFILTCPSLSSLCLACHVWFVVNEKGKLTRYEIRNLSDKNKNHFYINYFSPFYGRGFSIFTKKFYFKSKLCCEINGNLAKKMITFIKENSWQYPYVKKYNLFGPNSNTYVQWVLNSFPSIKKKLPWNAIGKNYFKNKK